MPLKLRFKEGSVSPISCATSKSSEGLHVSETSISEEETIAVLAGKMGKDFDDALQYYVAKKEGASAIVSLTDILKGWICPGLRLEMQSRSRSELIL